jgi:hypothetical protein
MTKIFVVTPKDGKPGPLNGPFIFEYEQNFVDNGLIGILIGFAANVASGVSAYNKNDMENSSNLKSYALECFDELKSELPEAAALIENLCIDCSHLSAPAKQHPIWRLDRAILRTLPGVEWLE